MAAQLLTNHDFANVYQLEGGIEAWEGLAVEGPREFHLQFVRGDETPQEVIIQAYNMESGLKSFHNTVRSRSTDPEIVELLGHLVSAEEGHMRRLIEVSSKWGLSPEQVQAFGEKAARTVMEGGIDVDEFMGRNEPFLQTVTSIIDLAMMVEAQALDLYLRMAAESQNKATREILFQIAEEEKVHLRALGRALDEHLAKSTSPK
jgi:rubrerythrin